MIGGVQSRAILNLQFERMAGKEICYEFDETGFTAQMPDSESRYGWGIVTAFIESDALFVLKSGSLFYTIPKRALSADQITSFRNLLSEKCIPSKL